MSGRPFTWPRQLALAFVGAALALLSNSCSRVVKLSVVEPGELAFAPAGHAGSKQPTATRRDSLATSEDGLLVVSGDSLLIYSRVNAPPSSNHAMQRDAFKFKRSSRELDVLGCVPVGSHWREWDGNLTIVGDSLRFVRWPVSRIAVATGSTSETLIAAPREITRVDLGETDVGNTVGALGIVTLITIGLVAFFKALSTKLWL